eukprot:15299796-Heterocapsa_arctica.AAC.1
MERPRTPLHKGKSNPSEQTSSRRFGQNTYMCCKRTGLMLADKRELEPSLSVHHQKKCWSIGLGKLKEAFLKKYLRNGSSMQYTLAYLEDR